MTNKMIRTLGFVEVKNFSFRAKIKRDRIFEHPSDLGRYFYLEDIIQAAGGGEKDE